MNAIPEGAQQAHPAAVAQEFIKRSDMKGGEVEAYAQTYNWLGEILAGTILVVPADGHKDLMDQIETLRAENIAYGDLHGPLPVEEEAPVEEDISVLEPVEDAGEPELDPVESDLSDQL